MKIDLDLREKIMVKRLYSLHWFLRSGLPSAMQSAATSSSLVTVSSKPLTSRVLFETRVLTSALSPTAKSSAFPKAETSPPFFRTRRISSLLVLRMERTSALESWGFTLAFMAFRISAQDSPSFADTLTASPDLVAGKRLGKFPLTQYIIVF